MAYTIEFDYDSTMKSVARIRGIADEMSSMMSTSVVQANEALHSGWKGQSATVMNQRCEELAIDLKKKVDELYSLADRLSSIASYLKNAEEQAKAQMGQSGTTCPVNQGKSEGRSSQESSSSSRGRGGRF